MEQPMKAMKAMKEMKMPKMKKEKSTKPRLENLWVNFLKDYAKSNGITYSCAISDPRAKEEYKMMKMPKKEETPITTKKEQAMEMMNSKILKRTKKPVKKSDKPDKLAGLMSSYIN